MEPLAVPDRRGSGGALSGPRPDPDQAAVRAALRGDAGAWTQLVDRHAVEVYALCRRLAVDSDDCCQEIWLRAYTRLSTYRPDVAPFRSWLMTVAHRYLIDRHRVRTRRAEVPLDGDVHGTGDPEQALIDRQHVASLEAAIATLPEPQRRVLVLHHLHGVSLAHIAGTEGVAVGTVKSRLHRARAALALAWRAR